MKKLIAVAALAAAFAAPSALAGEDMTLASLDTDANGTLSLTEVQAKKPEVTAEKFAKADTDASGELSEAEFTAWKAEKAAKKAEKAAE
jgi:hypothetical protein